MDVSHELGHLILHRHVPQVEKNKSDVAKLMEKQAFRFGGAFLMPETTFTHDLLSLSLDAMVELKSKWRIAVSAMIYRLAELELISDSQQKRLRINLSRRGWRKREPLDDTLVPEQPRLLERSITLLLERGVTNKTGLELMFGLPIQSIQSVLGISMSSLDDEIPLDMRHDEDDPPTTFKFPPVN